MIEYLGPLEPPLENLMRRWIINNRMAEPRKTRRNEQLLLRLEEGGERRGLEEFVAMAVESGALVRAMARRIKLEELDRWLVTNEIF